jgi:phenylacetate-CoA ligase
MASGWERLLKAGGWRLLETLGRRSTLQVLADSAPLSELSGEEYGRQRLFLLNQIWKNVTLKTPFYQERGLERTAIATEDDLDQIPIIDKDDFRHRAVDFVPSTLRRPATISVSGGSTGSPVTSFSDPDASGIVKAAMIEGRQWWDIHPWTRCLSVWGHSKYLGAGWKGKWKLSRQRFKDAVANRRVIPAYDLSSEAVKKYNAAWHRDQPRYLVGYATALYEIARKHRELNLPIPTGNHIIMSTGEVLHEWQAELIQSVMRCPVIEEYGLVEAGAVAYTNPNGQGLKVLSNHFIVEVVSDDGQPVAVGQEGRIVVTSLRRQEIPLLRYDTGDRAIRLDPAASRDVRCISKVLGRTYDLVRCSDGTAVPGVIFTHAMKPLKEVRRFQVVQRKIGRAFILYVSDRPLSAEVVYDTKNKIEHAIGHSFQVDLEWREAIDTASSGKYRWIRVELE